MRTLQIPPPGFLLFKNILGEAAGRGQSPQHLTSTEQSAPAQSAPAPASPAHRENRAEYPVSWGCPPFATGATIHLPASRQTLRESPPLLPPIPESRASCGLSR